MPGNHRLAITAPDRHGAFERLYRVHAPSVLAYALRRTGADSAHDVVAETFLVAWRRFNDIPPDPAPWLFGVARKTVANERRASRRRAALATRLETERSPTVAPAGKDATRAHAALASVPEVDQEVLRLIAWEGLDARAAAGVVGCSVPALRVRLHRARKRFAKALRHIDGELNPGERQELSWAVGSAQPRSKTEAR